MLGKGTRLQCVKGVEREGMGSADYSPALVGREGETEQ